MSNQKVWFITGASKGMGLEITKAVIASGSRVIATSRSMGELIQNLGDKTDQYLPLVVDITNEGNVQQALAEGVNTFGKIDVLVNNAGFYLVGSMEEISDDEFRRTMDVNVFGTANVIRYAMPYLRQQRSGHVINIASYLGYVGFANTGTYNAAKFAIVGLSEALAQEVKPFDVRVTVVAPGMFRTGFLSSSTLAVTRHKIADYKVDEQEKMLQRFDGKQPGDPARLAQVLVEVSGMTEPPLHLALGTDSYQAIRQHRAAEDKELKQWKHLTLSTDYQ